ncbi:hypothetical protein [Streptomyces malaysiensis]|uniref:hypothetical protein n=1 Tax=Streptomyces malaysiensis TaxID=92644 RepID=UPI000852F243|nr:hypothetical protein [Streptomyces sp. SPMA113]
MARRDIEKILNELGEVRRVLDDPAAGLAAFHQDQDELRRKVLENIQLSTTGLREENRELRRRQEKMLSDLSDTRAAVEALRREIAQAWAHTISASNAAAVPGGATAELAQREQRVLEVGTDGGGEAGREEAVDEGTESAEHDGDAAREEQDQGEVSAAPSAEQEPPPPASASASDAPTTEAVATPTDESEEDWKKVDYRRHMDSVLKAGAIASARLVCHRDTWTFVIEQTSQHPHFRHPDCVSALEDGRIETFLSGRSLLAVMVTMRKILDDRVAGDPEMATWALANAVYLRTQLAVADAKHTRPDGAEVTTIVLDDRPVPAHAS